MDDFSLHPGLGHNGPPDDPPPPTLSREERFAPLAKDVDDLADRGTKLPVEIESDEHVARYAEVVNATRDLTKRIEATRKGANEPHRKAQAENNDFFGAFVQRLDRMKRILEERATRFLDEKAAAERRRRAEEAARLHAEAEARAREAAEAPFGIEAEIAQETAEHAAQQAARAAHVAGGSTAELARTRTAGGTVTSKTDQGFRVVDYSKLDLRELRESFTVDEIDKAIRAHIRRHKKTKPLTGVEIFETSKASFRG